MLLTLLLGACATLPPAAGTPRAQVLQLWGPPTAEYALPAGVQRLEYASGPYGRTTWMLDLDAEGRLQQARQVLNEAEFNAVMAQTGQRAAEVRQRLGTPGEVRPLGWRGGEVWGWRYPTNDCLWFEISFSAEGRVQGGGYGADPRCDTPADRD
ncbi:hypothetical protein IP87_02170 [beta proteobacterium AAP121]|nr:hypothetical protein IP80_01895 [beta proteobacterium AAP65]KPG00625.1 hypothetical protein IP87_02170 [beta proteobacterium AAP121]